MSPEGTALRSAAALGALKRFASGRPAPVEEACELCAAKVSSLHPHLLEPATRRILCSCDPCAILFQDRTDGRYRRVPRDVRALSAEAVSNTQWDALGLPVHLVFFVRSSIAGKVVALYPSPAGAMESSLPLDGWTAIEAAVPAVQTMQADVEALLVYRVRDQRVHLLAPIDECYRLVGLVRARRGHVSTAGVDGEVAAFLDALKERALPA